MSLRVKIFISLLLTLFLAGNFLFLNPNKVLAQADPLSPAILLQNYLTQLETAKQTAIQQKDTQTLKIIEQEIKDTKKQQRKQWLKDTWVKLRDKVLLRSVNIAYKNALRTFLSRLAFDTATRIAEGGLGKSPLFNIKKLGSFVDEVYETTLVDTLDILAKDNGFFKFDICQPGDINLKLAIQYSLFGNFAGRGARGKPRCTFRQISERWTEWSQQVGRTFSSDNLLRTLKDSFSPVQSDVGIYLKLDSSIRDKLADQKTKEMFDYVSREGIQPLTEPITGFIKTPAAFTSEQAKQALAKNAPIPETIQTKDIIADAFGIFTNTLASKLMKRLLEKGLTEGHRAQTTMVFNWVNQQVARSGAAQAFAQLAEIHPSASVEPIAEFLSQCPDAARPGPTDCVINANLLGALEQHLTVKEALKNGQLRGDGLVGYKNGNQPLNYLNHFPYRSLVIMRIHRLIPVGWELAALYNIRTSTEKSLQEIVNCFEDKNPANINNPRYPANCVADTNRDGTVNDSDYNPYYHLIDPHWVLKAPESLCRRRGFGYDIVSSSMDCVEDNVDGTKEKEGGELVEGPSCEAKVNPDKEVLVVQRSEDYCADRQTCLAHDASGKCLGEYGYCLKEKDIWRFPGGQSCDLTPYYNTCETLSRTADSQEFSYLRNTLQPCDEIDGGCLWYSTQGRRVVANSVQTWPWQSDSRIYLNDRAGDCPANQVGCTKLSRMLPGVNTVFNGDFKLSLNDQTPDGWVLTENRCQLAYSAENKILTVLPNVDFPANAYCIVESAGFIPVDVNFEYALSVALKRNSQLEKKAEVGLKFFNATKNPMGSARYNILDNDNGVSLTPAEEWQVYQATSTLPEGAHFAKIILATGPFDANNEEDLGEVSFDSLQLVITKSPVVRHNLPNFSFNPDDQEDYNTDYSQDNSYARQYLKVAPSYLVCQGYNEILPAYNDSAACLNDGHYWRSDLKRCALSGDDRCDNYALECKANEVGCQGYLPANGDPEVSGVTTNADVCPETCVGYNHYLEAPTYFDKVEDPAAEKHAYDFIPETAQACPVAAAGCEQFTNLSGQSSEESEYFTYLRQCVQRNANANFYYTWEGSDTTGFQLKKWEFLKSNLDEGPCTNVTLGVTGCSDTQAHQAVCSAEELVTNPDCRNFFAIIDNNPVEYPRLESRTITISDNCAPYRRAKNDQIYNADPNYSQKCAVQFNGCREYSGNQGNNVRNSLTDNFESRTIGNWLNSNRQTLGLSPSNEALDQGGHSLKVAVVNDTVIHPVTGTTVGKQYLLSFLAKKAGGNNKENPANNEAGATFLDFTVNGDNLTSNWRQYQVGPVELGSLSGRVFLRLRAEALGGDQALYLDNVILKEYTSNFYLINNTWKTPAICDTPLIGAELFCQQYTDRDKKTHYLKSFTSLCSAAAIGCEAYLNTQNSTGSQAEKVYDDGLCSSANGVIITQDARSFCQINGRTVCQVTAGSSCRYLQPIKVLNDAISYLVNDPNKQCDAKNQGCQMLGQPAFDRQNDNYLAPDYIKSYSLAYKFNNPDAYGSSLCSEAGLFCSRFNGEISTNKTYYDPELLSFEQAAKARTCEFAGGEWVKKGSTDPCPAVSAGQQFLPPFNQYDYDGWVGLCPAEVSSCTEFRDPKDPQGDEVEQCDSQISPQLKGLCVVGQNRAARDGNYCVLPLSGVGNKVCLLNDGRDDNGDGYDNNDCFYTSGDWICTGLEAAYDGSELRANHGDCRLPNGKKVCFISDRTNDNVPNQNGTCVYSLACQPYYYLKNSLDKNETCSEVDSDAGCLLFYDTSNSRLDKSALGSEEKQAPASCDSATPAPFGNNNYCDANELFKFKKDRECAEWLECRTGFLTGDDSDDSSTFACLDLYRCSQKGLAGSSKDCNKIIATQEAAKPFYNLSPAPTTEVNKIRQLSGYSRPGLKWSDGLQIAGSVSPEAMVQRGQAVPVVNGGFESYLANDLSRPEGWLNAYWTSNDVHDNYLNGNCGQSLDNAKVNVHSGRYSLKINLKSETNGINCFYRSNAGNNSGFYPVLPQNRYNLSFYAKGETGGQRAIVGFRWFDGNGQEIDVTDQYNRGIYFFLNIQPLASQWQKYILTVGSETTKAIPDNARLARILIYNFKSAASAKGAIWYDDFQIEPVLDLSPTAEVAKDCRLYPTEEAPSCSYLGRINKYEGWSGYCLEPDPAYQKDPSQPNNFQSCLQWYPVDSLLGDRLSVFDVQNIGYADRAPLYYCLQTKGTYNYLPRQQNDFIGTSGYKYQSVINLNLVNGGVIWDDCSNGIGDITNGITNNIATCSVGLAGWEWESACVPTWACGGYSFSDVNFDGHNDQGNCSAYRNEAACNNTDVCRWTGNRCNHKLDTQQEAYRACRVINGSGCWWGANADDCSVYRTADTCDDHTETCQWIGQVEEGPSNYCGDRCNDPNNDAPANCACVAKGTVESCGKYSASECPVFTGCAFQNLRPVDEEGGRAGAWVWADQQSLTLEEIGAIYFEVVAADGDAWPIGGFLSDITNQLDSVDHLQKNPQYYSKFDKVFQITQTADSNNWFSMVMAFGVYPGENIRRLLRFEYSQDDVSGGSGGIAGRIYYYLKDQCAVIAQPIKIEGGVVKEKAFFSRFTNQVHPLGYSKELEAAPYGSFYPPRNTTPEYWSIPIGADNRKDAPLYVYNGGSFDFGPSAGLPWSVPASSGSERICVSSENGQIGETGFIGKSCLTSKDCGTSGVCSGIGKYCYNNTTGLMNGTACNGNTCPTGYTCRMPGADNNNPDDPVGLKKNTNQALQALQQLFAKVYGVWRWSTNNGRYEPLGDLTLDISNVSRPRPFVNPLRVFNDQNRTPVGNNALRAPGGRIELNFNTGGNDDQLPVEGIWINWQDGNIDYFKGPFGYKTYPSTPFKAYHIYTCYTNERGDRCVLCANGVAPDGAGVCAYNPPKVNIKDHWGWCSNGPEGTPQGFVDETACNPNSGAAADSRIEIRPQ